MRTKEEIMRDVEGIAEVGDFEQYLIEVLIDIRNLLDNVDSRLLQLKDK